MPYKLGGKKPQMNNASSIKTNAAMYASKTSMYKPMLAPGNGDDEKKKVAAESAEHSGIRPGTPKVGGGEAQTKQMYNEDEQIKNLRLISKVKAKAAYEYKRNKGEPAGNTKAITDVIKEADPNLSDDQVKGLYKRLTGHYHAGYKG